MVKTTSLFIHGENGVMHYITTLLRTAQQSTKGLKVQSYSVGNTAKGECAVDPLSFMLRVSAVLKVTTGTL